MWFYRWRMVQEQISRCIDRLHLHLSTPHKIASSAEFLVCEKRGLTMSCRIRHVRDKVRYFCLPPNSIYTGLFGADSVPRAKVPWCCGSCRRCQARASLSATLPCLSTLPTALHTPTAATWTTMNYVVLRTNPSPDDTEWVFSVRLPPMPKRPGMGMHIAFTAEAIKLGWILFPTNRILHSDDTSKFVRCAFLTSHRRQTENIKYASSRPACISTVWSTGSMAIATLSS